jgi:hypothetical protein
MLTDLGGNPDNNHSQTSPYTPNIVKTLAASLRQFYNIEGQRKTLAARLHHFTRFIARFIPLLPAYDIFTTLKDSEKP